MTTRTRQLITTAAALLALGIAPGAANAGSYQVRSCDDAGGAQNAWIGWASHQQMAAYSACPSYGDWGRAIVARNAIPQGSLIVPKNSGAWQFFTAPEGTGITNVHFSGELHRAAGQRWNVGLSNGSQMLAGVSADTTYAWSWKPSGADIAVPGDRTVYWEAVCFAPSGCDTQSTGDPATHYARAAIWIRGTVVTISDPTAPALSWGGSLLSGGWIRGDRSLDWAASDNSGIANVAANLSGRGLIGADRPCDFTRPQPCAGSDGGSTTVSTAAWPDGQHRVELGVHDAAGNPAALAATVAIDNTAPARIASLTVDGGEGWRPTNGFTLRWATPAGQHAPIIRSRYRLCPADGGACTDATHDGAGEAITLNVARPGTWRAQVWLEDAAGNQTSSNASDPVTLRFDDTVPPAAAIDAPSGWVGDADARELAIHLHLADGTSAPVSGIAGYSVTRDGTDPDATIDTDATWTLTDLAEGDHTLKARAISGAGKPSATITTATINVDRSAPAADAAGLPDPGAWQREPVSVQLRGSDQRSGVGAIRWRIDDGARRDDSTDHTTLTIADDGRHTITWETVDRAGNTSQARQAVVRVDRTAPEQIQFEPTDPNRPRIITADVSDAGSGIAGGQIEMRSAGGSWQQLATRTTAGDGRLEAILDDDNLPDGRYELRATATDRVGNQRTSDRRADGSPAQLTLPIRLTSHITLARATTRTRRGHTAPNRPMRGTILTTEGRPIAGAPIRVLTRARTERDWTPQRTITADRDGRFTYTTPAGPSRTIRFAYAGTDTVRGTTTDRSVTTRARTTITASRRSARLGQATVFSGRLKGGPVPSLGKVLELQAYDGGRWRSFPQTVRTDARGRWRTVLRFERTRGKYTYKIRARLFADGSYPYQLGYSRTIRLTIHGR